MLISADRAAGEHGRPSPLLRAGGRFWSATPKQTCPRPRPRAQLAFKDSMIHGILQFTLSIAFRYILHRGESRDIRCRESCFYLIHVFFSGDPSAQRRLGHASMFWNSWCGSHRCRVFDTNLPPVQGGTGRVRVPAPLHRTKRDAASREPCSRRMGPAPRAIARECTRRQRGTLQATCCSPGRRNGGLQQSRLPIVEPTDRRDDAARAIGGMRTRRDRDSASPEKGVRTRSRHSITSSRRCGTRGRAMQRGPTVHTSSRARVGKETSSACLPRLLPCTIQGPEPTMILPQVHLR